MEGLRRILVCFADGSSFVVGYFWGIKVHVARRWGVHRCYRAVTRRFQAPRHLLYISLQISSQHFESEICIYYVFFCDLWLKTSLSAKMLEMDHRAQCFQRADLDFGTAAWPARVSRGSFPKSQPFLGRFWATIKIFFQHVEWNDGPLLLCFPFKSARPCRRVGFFRCCPEIALRVCVVLFGT